MLLQSEIAKQTLRYYNSYYLEYERLWKEIIVVYFHIVRDKFSHVFIMVK